jgi:hypothetical protein
MPVISQEENSEDFCPYFVQELGLKLRGETEQLLKYFCFHREIEMEKLIKLPQQQVRAWYGYFQCCQPCGPS